VISAPDRRGSTVATGGSGPVLSIASFHQRTRSPAGIGGQGLPSFFASLRNLMGASLLSANGM
jgi:hypothetical protein